jgi:DNA-directed RNA polymerase specialized sigma24 family protein
MHGAGGRLPPTSWTLLAAAQGEGSAAAIAREEFARRYYPPVYAYLAAIVRNPDEAEELAQGFFAQTVATGRLLAGVDQAKGGFRVYLKQALRNYVIDWQRKQGHRPQAELRPDADSGA